ncbi:MAG: hypothetical protein ACRC5H_04220 [Treponemataceae bacterium]
MQNNIKKTLAEVRKAYRFLYSYQQRILDLIKYISGKFGLTYKGGYPKFADPSPRCGRGSLDTSAWDWLNLYFYDFHFTADEKGTIHFSILLLNDTGYFEEKDKGINKENIKDFTSINESKSELIFIVGKNIWQEVWKEPEFFKKDMGTKETGENKIMLFKHYNIEDFENESKTEEKLKDFADLCKENNINFELKEFLTHRQTPPKSSLLGE